MVIGGHDGGQQRRVTGLFGGMTLSFYVIVLLIPFGNGHLASLFDNGEPKSPILGHSRESRGPLLSSMTQEGHPLSKEAERLSFLKPPSYQHKNFYSNRLANFHGTSQPGPATARLGPAGPNIFQGANGEVNFEQLLSKLGGADGGGMDDKEQPTFTPYISARALSNMEKFFHHLRENLEALQKDDEEQGEGSEGMREIGPPERRREVGGTEEQEEPEPDLTSSSPEKAMAYLFSHSSHEWKPMASGVLGLKKIRSFFPLAQNSESRARLGTNLGLGRKK